MRARSPSRGWLPCGRDRRSRPTGSRIRRRRRRSRPQRNRWTRPVPRDWDPGRRTRQPSAGPSGGGCTPRVSSTPLRRDGRSRVPPGLGISVNAMGQTRHASRLRRAIPANTGPDLHGHGGHEVSGLQIRRGLPRIRQGRTRQPRVPLVRPVGPGETNGQAKLSTLSW